QLDAIVVIHFVDGNGHPKFVKELPPRAAYRTITHPGEEFVIVTVDNRDYRVFVILGDWKAGRAYRGVARIKDGQPRDSVKIKTSVCIDKLTNEQIKEISRRDSITYAEALRQVIEWGLEAAGEDYEL
ncbi:MAG: hypothetical protein B7Z37_23525, partial [Verrucomicrobia bacterium 12-59-8]